VNADTVIAIRYSLRREPFTLEVETQIPLRGITGIYGVSGAGKTTLLRCIAGLEKPSVGTLVVAGDEWQGATVARAVHERPIAYVFQEPRLFEHLDVLGNIDYGRKRRPAAAESGPVIELLGIGHLLDRHVADLSGGEAQRVAIARALLSSPQFVLMDEPLASLDRARRAEILPFLERLHSDSSIPIVYVSHNIDEICRLCDHLLVMDSGRLVADGPLQDVLLRTDLPSLSGDEAGSVITATVAAYDQENEILRLMSRAGELWVPGARREPGTPLRLRIRANDVSLCRHRPAESTILNILPAEIDAIEEDPGASSLLRLTAGGETLLARVTRKSVAALKLRAGDKVFAQVKSVAVRQQLHK
jgi:molybdate transport system ATP-binding protein